MEAYYQTTYLSCPKEPSFLSSPDFLKPAYHIGSVLNLFLSSYCVFLIATKSPSSMKSAIPFMLNLTFWTLICDLTWSVLVTPMFFMPVIGAGCYGILCNRVPYSWIVLLALGVLGGMGVSIVVLLEQRQRSIVGNSRYVMKKKSTRFMIFTVLYIYHINLGIPEMLTYPHDQEQAKLNALKLVPCPPEVFFTDRATVIQVTATLLNVHMYFTAFTISAACAFYGLHTLYHLLPRNNPSMSLATRKMLLNFYVAMSILIAIPMVVILVPAIFLNMSVTFGFYSQTANNIAILIFTMHGISSSIATCVLFTPYRRYTKSVVLHKLLRYPEDSSKPSIVISTYQTSRVDTPHFSQNLLSFKKAAKLIRMSFFM